MEMRSKLTIYCIPTILAVVLEDGSSTEKHRFERIVMNTTKTQRGVWRSGGVEEYGGVSMSKIQLGFFIFMVFFRVLCVHVYCHTRVIVAVCMFEAKRAGIRNDI